MCLSYLDVTSMGNVKRFSSAVSSVSVIVVPGYPARYLVWGHRIVGKCNIVITRDTRSAHLCGETRESIQTTSCSGKQAEKSDPSPPLIADFPSPTAGRS